MCAYSLGLWQAQLAEKEKIIANLRHKLENDSAEGTVRHLPSSRYCCVRHPTVCSVSFNVDNS